MPYWGRSGHQELHMFTDGESWKEKNGKTKLALFLLSYPSNLKT